jgi:hypothetical protein
MAELDPKASLSFNELITKYSALQACVVKQIKSLASSLSKASPGKFLLAQFGMSQVTQIGDSISNLIAQVNAVINYSVRQQRGQ